MFFRTRSAAHICVYNEKMEYSFFANHTKFCTCHIKFVPVTSRICFRLRRGESKYTFGCKLRPTAQFISLANLVYKQHLWLSYS